MKDEPKLPEGWVDWNTLEMDALAEHLDEKFRFSSSGTAFAVHRMVEFYEAHKNCKHDPKSNSEEKKS